MLHVKDEQFTTGTQAAFVAAANTTTSTSRRGAQVVG